MPEETEVKKVRCQVSGEEILPTENAANKPQQVTLPNNVMVEVRAWVGNRPHDSVLSQKSVLTAVEQAVSALSGGVQPPQE